ncbi:MAG: FadR family transcriptional regulator [Betaproteobacteria bacterium]|nr:FadR family transcriptional regulator [Betaproteobacteria bacterium]
MVAGAIDAIINWSDHLSNSRNPVPLNSHRTVPIQSIEPQRLYRQIADQLRQLISKGEYAVGARLPAERELAAQLGVSRPSVREALIALEVEGWVEVRTGSGVYVQERSSHGRNDSVAPTEWGPAGVDSRQARGRR